MKFNWGTGLVIFFILFVGSLAFILYKSTQIDHSLVIENYYDEDIRYQEHYNKLKNTAELPEKVRIDYSSGQPTALLTFPNDSLSVSATGKIRLYNPISIKSDKVYEFQTNASGQFRLPIQGLSSGRWKIKIDWKQGNKAYYQEQEITI